MHWQCNGRAFELVLILLCILINISYFWLKNLQFAIRDFSSKASEFIAFDSQDPVGFNIRSMGKSHLAVLGVPIPEVEEEIEREDTT